jgi:hypothetical protein
MANIDDASVKLLFAADSGTRNTVDDLPKNRGFDAIMDIEIGANLNQIAGSFDVRIGVRNLTQSRNVAVVAENRPLTSSGATRLETVTLSVAAADVDANTEIGDVLQLVGSYRVNAGVRRDVSMVESPTFIVSEPV